MVKTYNAKTLFRGYKINPKFKDIEEMVAVPLGKGYTHAKFDGVSMKLLDTPLSTRVFEDKFGRGSYTMGYYKWGDK